MAFATYRHAAARPLHRGALVLLGDAAHSMNPHLGQGANLALEDAWVFARALADCGSFHEAARRFAAARAGKHAFYGGISRLLAPFFQSDGRIKAWGRDLALPIFPHLPGMRRQMALTVAGLKQGWLSFGESEV
jgi:2-polyprenyl-6-methoxyphenol hydroxylase-like FAD-dependent oxidoreductase